MDGATSSTDLRGLIAPSEAIFDADAVAAAFAVAEGDTASPKEIRSATVATLKRALLAGREVIETALTETPLDARAAARSYAYLVDRVVSHAFDVSCRRLHPLPNPTGGERLSLLAVGGYGRGEMAPFSDVDLLFLTPYKITPWAESVIESTLYILWDLHLKVGHASRTIKECLRLGREDFTIRTALLEHRYLAGDTALADEIDHRLWSDLFSGTEAQFIEAKLKERGQRHRRQGGQRYVLEPNVKEGKGGLRDLQTLYWIAKYVAQVGRTEDLMTTGMFRESEMTAFHQAENFLLAVRAQLHLIAGRAADQLTFDMQVEVADRFGYKDGGGRRAVEHFMQAYFRQATRVGELTRIFLTALEANHTKKQPMLVRLFKRRKRAKAPYAIKQNRLTVADEAAFFADKLNMLRIFESNLYTTSLKL